MRKIILVTFCLFFINASPLLAENNKALLTVSIGNQSFVRPNEKIKLYVDKKLIFDGVLPVKNQHYYEHFPIHVDTNNKHSIVIIAEESHVLNSVFLDVTKDKYVLIDYDYSKEKELYGFVFFISDTSIGID